MTIRILGFACLLGCAAAAPCVVTPPPPTHPVETTAPAPNAVRDALARMIHDNGEFVAESKPEHFSDILNEQHPVVTIVACSDSRVTAHSLSKQTHEGIAFGIRNIGNQIDSAAGSVEYGVRHLHTPLLLILGHVRCGAIKAALTDYEEESSAVRRELDSLTLSLRHMPQTDTPEKRWLEGVKSNVHEQVRLALREYGDLTKSGALTIVGAVYDFSGEMGGPQGKLWIINLNGETDPARVDASPLLVDAREHAK